MRLKYHTGLRCNIYSEEEFILRNFILKKFTRAIFTVKYVCFIVSSGERGCQAVVMYAREQCMNGLFVLF